MLIMEVPIPSNPSLDKTMAEFFTDVKSVTLMKQNFYTKFNENHENP